ncbi:class I SAM-dependent methyltransferase [Candidatus Parcubacteria bacterium]|nr:class I SAM-dependent methyltransferase [Candidatus Parcubacteria bacterium]
MKEHLNNLAALIPNLYNKRMLDVGAGEGGFLIECAKRGLKAEGIELNQSKVERARTKALKEGLDINIIQGEAENMPLSDSAFDFLNVAEVIEHVKDPEQVLSEMHRVMQALGQAYVSVHNRFGLYDTHFHIYFLGWMPRSLAEKYLTLLKKNKDYEKMPDNQRISEMHYYTFGQFKKLAQRKGFKVTDLREIKLFKKFGYPLGFFLVLCYRMSLRPLYFSTFHYLLEK